MRRNVKYIVGIDEAGRGPLAGPITVAGVCIPKTFFSNQFFKGVRDSKQLTARAREEWFLKIKAAQREGKLSYAASFGSASRIDKLGLSKVVRIAIRRILFRLELNPQDCQILLDGGLRAPAEFFQKTIIGGDDTIPLISTAAVVAKVMRDRRMRKYAVLYPKYNFDIHKGYGTLLHRRLIKKHGPSQLHRLSFLSRIT